MENRQLPELDDFPAFKQEQDRLFVSVIERREELMHLPDGRTFRVAITPIHLADCSLSTKTLPTALCSSGLTAH